MSRLDSSIPQILGTDGDGRRQALIQWVSSRTAGVRAALLIPDDLTDPVFGTRQAALQAAAVGWPASGEQVDPDIDIDNENPRECMTQRQTDGKPWVPALGMPQVQATSSTGIAQPDPDNIPAGAIVTTLDWPPAADLEVTDSNPVGSRFTFAPGSDANMPDFVKGTAPNGVGSTYWPAADDDSHELSTFTGSKGGKYQKLSVLGLHPNAAAETVWVRLV